MLTKKVLLVLVGLCAVAAFAQENRVYVGARAGIGVGLSRRAGPDKKEWEMRDGEKYMARASFDIAPFVSFQLADMFALQTELQFTRFGFGTKLTEDDVYYGFVSGEKGDWEYTSRAALVIPVLAQLTIAERKVNIFAGPHFTINMGAYTDSYNWMGESESKKWSNEDMDEWKEDMKYPPVGLTVGASFAAGPVFFDIRYLTDLGKLAYKDAGKEVYGYKMPDVGIRRAKLSFTIGYEFGIGSR